MLYAPPCHLLHVKKEDGQSGTLSATDGHDHRQTNTNQSHTNATPTDKANKHCHVTQINAATHTTPTYTQKIYY